MYSKFAEDYYQLKEDVPESELAFLRAKMERVISRRWFLRGAMGAAAAAGMGGLLAACGNGQTAKPSGDSQQTQVGKMVVRKENYPTYEGTPTFKPGSTVTTWRLQTDPSNMNPITRLCSDYGACDWMFDWLIDLDPYTLAPIPCVAKKWEIKDDQIYTFYLRDDVKWWDGTPLTAEDVAFTMDAYQNEPESSLKAVYAKQEKIEVIDPLTLRVTLSQPYGPYLAWGGQMFIARKKDFYPEFKGHVDDAPATFKPMGSGGWKFKELVVGSHVEFAANRDWWRGSGWKPNPTKGGPYIEKLIQRHITDAEAALAAFIAGEVDSLWPVAPKDIERLQDVSCWLYDTYSTVSEFMQFNFKNPDRPNKTIFSDIKVRQALAHAIDREKMGQAVWRGYWEPRNHMELHPWMLKPYEQTKWYEYSPTKAKDLLAQAGWKPGSDGILQKDGEKFKIQGICGKTYLAPDYATVVQQFFKEVGIEMSLEVLESAALRKRTREDFTWDVFFRRHWGWGYPESFREFMCDQVPPVAYNYGSYCTPKMEDLWTKIMATTDMEKAKQLFWQLEDFEAEDLPALFFGVPHDLLALQKRVKGHQPNPMWQDWDPFWWWVD